MDTISQHIHVDNYCWDRKRRRRDSALGFYPMLSPHTGHELTATDSQSRDDGGK